MATYAVNHEVLVWAREECGLSREQAATELERCLAKADPFQHLVDVESGDRLPSLTLLQAMASKYKVSLITLFRPQCPPAAEIPTDFRTLGGHAPILGRNTRLAIRSATRWHEMMADLLQDAPHLHQQVELPIVRLDDNPVMVAQTERNRLGIAVEDQRNCKNARKAFDMWRWRVEELGILVFEVTMPVEECRGFALGGNQMMPPAIVINHADEDTARTFTLFHEYAHILLRLFGICGHSEDVDERRIETYSNNFAAELLMPEVNVIELANATQVSLHSDFDRVLRAIRIVRGYFKVSGEAAVVRLERLRLVPVGSHSEYVRTMRVRNRSKGGSGEYYERRFLNKFGNRYIDIVLTAMQEGIIDMVDASEMLDRAKTRWLSALSDTISLRRQDYGHVL